MSKNNKAKDTVNKATHVPTENKIKSLNKNSILDILDKLNTIDIKIGKVQDKEVIPYDIP